MFEWGIGLRPQHFKEWLKEEARPLFEILTDNYIYQKGGPALDILDRLVSHRAPLLHGIGLNIGGRDPIDRTYLKRLKDLQARTRATLISDHLCFCRGLGIETYDLLPLPYTMSELIRVCQRVSEVQDYLGQALCLENISAYVQFSGSSMSEVEFLMELSQRTGCQILLDINNLFVSSSNLGWDAGQQLHMIAVESVAAMHISGYSFRGDCLYDSHDQAVSDPVLALLQTAIELGIRVPVILERDDADLEYADLIDEWKRVQALVPKVSDWSNPSSKAQPCALRVEGDELHPAPDLQSEFMAQLLSDLKVSPPRESTLHLQPQDSHRWLIYVNGILGRWTSLIDVTLKRAAEVWGKPAIAELMLDFSSQYPPHSPDMTQSFRLLPQFVRQHPEYSRVSGLADLLESCFLYWDILEGEDPSGATQDAQAPRLARLMQPAFLHKPWQSGLDLHTLWVASAACSPAQATIDWPNLNENETANLFIKTANSSVQVLAIAPEVYSMVEALVQGHNLADAVTVWAEQDALAPEAQLENLLRETLVRMQTAGCLKSFSHLN